jgi:hypothetical protein
MTVAGDRVNAGLHVRPRPPLLDGHDGRRREQAVTGPYRLMDR